MSGEGNTRRSSLPFRMGTTRREVTFEVTLRKVILGKCQSRLDDFTDASFFVYKKGNFPKKEDALTSAMRPFQITNASTGEIDYDEEKMYLHVSMFEHPDGTFDEKVAYIALLLHDKEGARHICGSIQLNLHSLASGKKLSMSANFKHIPQNGLIKVEKGEVKRFSVQMLDREAGKSRFAESNMAKERMMTIEVRTDASEDTPASERGFSASHQLDHIIEDIDEAPMTPFYCYVFS